jgi:hypothetical protein
MRLSGPQSAVNLNGGVELMGPDRIGSDIWFQVVATVLLAIYLSIRLMFVNIQDATFSYIDRPAPTSVDRSARSADFPLC